MSNLGVLTVVHYIPSSFLALLVPDLIQSCLLKLMWKRGF